MERSEIYGIGFLLVLLIIFIIIKIYRYRLMISSYDNLKLGHHITILLFDDKCEYCNQVAVRRSNPGNHLHCTNHKCSNEAYYASKTPFGSSNGPLDGSTGWKINKEYTNKYQLNN